MASYLRRLNAATPSAQGRRSFRVKPLFAVQALDRESAEWPLLFWQLLLAQPALRRELDPGPHDPFSLLVAGQRAVLLLRLVAGLDELQGADVLDVPVATYRHGLYRALETLRTHGIDEPTLHQIRDSLQRDAKPAHAPIVAASASEQSAAESALESVLAARRLRRNLTAIAGLLLFVLAASFFWVPDFLRFGAASVKGFQNLRGHAPAATLSATETTVAGADFDLLADPQGERIAHDLDLYAWYAATDNVPATGATANGPLPETTLPETAAPEADAEDPLESTEATSHAALPVVPAHVLPGRDKPASTGADHGH